MQESFIDFYKKHMIRLEGLEEAIPISAVMVQELGNPHNTGLRGNVFYQQIFLLPSSSGCGYILDALGKYQPTTPQTERHRLENCTAYLTAKLAEAETLFTKLKQALLNNREPFIWDTHIASIMGYDPGGDGKLALDRIRDAANTYRKHLESVEAEYGKLDEIKIERKAMKKRAERDELHRTNQAIHDRQLKLDISKITLETVLTEPVILLEEGKDYEFSINT